MNATHDDAEFRLETRPSTFTGMSWWAVLRYKNAEYDEMLPADFPSWSEDRQDRVVAETCGRLKNQLRPILLAEDAKSRLVLPNEQTHAPVKPIVS